MKARITHKGLNRQGDTISLFDNDNREIAIRRNQIGGFIKLLKDINKKDKGSLEWLEYSGIVW